MNDFNKDIIVALLSNDKICLKMLFCSQIIEKTFNQYPLIKHKNKA